MIEFPGEIIQHLDKALTPEQIPKFLAFFFSASVSNGAENMNECLKAALKKGVPCLVETLKLVIKDIEKALDDEQYKLMMNDIYKIFLEPMEGHIDFQKLELMVTERQITAVQYNLIRSLSSLPPEMLETVISQIQIISRILSPSLGGLLGANTSRAVSILKNGQGKLVSVALVAVYLGWETIKCLSRWWKGEITGKRCAKIVVDSMATVGAGMAGGMLGGAAGGAIFGPLGMVIGGFIGGLAGGVAGESLSNWLTQKIFDIPKSEAVENAFKFLGIPHTSSVTDINSRFRQLCLKYHPDKGGNAEDFHKLQIEMAVIKLHRGENF